MSVDGDRGARPSSVDYCQCGRRWVAYHHPDGSCDLAGRASVSYTLGRLSSSGWGLTSVSPSTPGSGRCERLLCRLLDRWPR